MTGARYDPQSPLTMGLKNLILILLTTGPKCMCDFSTRMDKGGLWVRVSSNALEEPVRAALSVAQTMRTGFPYTEIAVTCLCEGAVDYLVKPVDGQRLRSAVSCAMERRRTAWR